MLKNGGPCHFFIKIFQKWYGFLEILSESDKY